MLEAIYFGRILDRGIYQERQLAADSHFYAVPANRPTGGEPNVNLGHAYGKLPITYK